MAAAPENGTRVGVERVAATKSGSGSKLTRFYTILAAVAVVGLAVVGYTVASSRMGGPVTEPIELEGVESDTALFELAEGVGRGDPEAPVVIHEFADYQCPGCGSFASRIEPLLVRDYVEPGKARLVFFDFPLVSIHDHAFLAARAARCAGAQERYWDYHAVLFGQQSRWSAAGDPADLFVEYAGRVGLDEDDFEACLESDRFARTVTANMQLAQRLGVNATPTIFVNGQRILNFRGYEDIADVIDEALAK